MSYVLTINGTNFTLPSVGETDWGNNVNSFFTAIASGTLQKTGGIFTLTNSLDFGPNYGLTTLSLKSSAADNSMDGFVCIENLGQIQWRNAANDNNLSLFVDANDDLIFNGTSLITDPTGTWNVEDRSADGLSLIVNNNMYVFDRKSNVCTCSAIIEWPSNSGTENVIVSLPFTCTSHAIGHIGIQTTSTLFSLYAVGSPGGDQFYLYKDQNGTPIQNLEMSDSLMYISFSYIATWTPPF